MKFQVLVLERSNRILVSIFPNPANFYLKVTTPAPLIPTFVGLWWSRVFRYSLHMCREEEYVLGYQVASFKLSLRAQPETRDPREKVQDAPN